MSQVIPFARKSRGKTRITPEEKREWGKKFQALLRTFNELKKMEHEAEWKIRVKCQKELKALETIRCKLNSINQDIKLLTQKLGKSN
ncbi:hypothetical protein ACFL35_20480 [Candidatus Riflebacteria bacterium]